MAGGGIRTRGAREGSLVFKTIGLQRSFARHILIVSGPGVCGSNYAQFPFTKLRRPIYPLDPHAAFAPERG